MDVVAVGVDVALQATCFLPLSIGLATLLFPKGFLTCLPVVFTGDALLFMFALAMLVRGCDVTDVLVDVVCISL